MKKIKALLAKAKPWLKKHWHMVLVVAVAAAIFLYIVLRKGTGVSAIAFPPATTAGGAAGDTGATTPATTDPDPASPVANPGTPGSTASGARVTSGGSLFDPPVQLKSVRSSQAIPTPTSFSQVQPVSNNPLAAALVAQGAGSSEALQVAKAIQQQGSGISQMWNAAWSLTPAPSPPLVVARPPAPRGPSGITQMWNAARSFVPVGQRSLPTPPKSAPAIPSKERATGMRF